MGGIFGIGISGIQAAQLGMVVTQHNITNSNTDGYNRQRVAQATAIPQGTSIGFQGNGVQITTIQRQYNNFLTEQVRTNEAELGSLESYFSQIQVIDDLLADPSAGVSPALQEFFDGVQQVAVSPSSLPARQSMVSSAQALVDRIQSVNQRMTDMYAQVNDQLSDTVDLINTYAIQIGKLNERITLAESAVNQPANDLLDQRDQLISELNKLVGVQVIPMQNNGIEILIGRGQLLVMGNQVNELSAVRSDGDPSRLAVAIDLGAGPQELPESVIRGGELDGLLGFRRDTLDVAVNSLGKFTTSLALTFNAQHAKGMDLLGNNADDPAFVEDFFQLTAPKAIPSTGTTGGIAVSFNAPELSALTSNGNYFVNVTASDYKLDFDGTTYTMTRLADGKVWTATSLGLPDDPATADQTELNYQLRSEGISIAENSPLAAGDTFTIQPTREIAGNISVNQSIAGDVRLIAAASVIKGRVGLQNQGQMSVSVERIVDERPVGSFDTFPMTVTFSGGALTFIDAGGLDVTGSVVAYDRTGMDTGTGAQFRTDVSYVIDGVMFSLKGSPQDGDTFLLEHNDARDPLTNPTIGVSDGSNILLLGRLNAQNTSDGGSAGYQGVYAQLVSDIGNKARQIEVTKTAQQSLVDQANKAREAESGVNLDEEAANLLKFQQLYQASARSITVGQKLFDELLSIARG